MNPQIERLKALVAQLIARLEYVQTENRRLTSILTTRDAELVQTKKRLEELRRSMERLAKSSTHQNDTLL